MYIDKLKHLFHLQESMYGKIGYPRPWVRTKIDNEGKQLWRHATDQEIRDSIEARVTVHW